MATQSIRRKLRPNLDTDWLAKVKEENSKMWMSEERSSCNYMDDFL